MRTIEEIQQLVHQAQRESNGEQIDALAGEPAVIGTQRLQYDVWGDTVNVASRMESAGEAGRAQVSEAFVGSLTSFRDDAAARHPEERSDEGPLFTFTPRGSIDIKGKGTMTTYWLEGA